LSIEGGDYRQITKLLPRKAPQVNVNIVRTTDISRRWYFCYVCVCVCVLLEIRVSLPFKNHHSY